MRKYVIKAKGDRAGLYSVKNSTNGERLIFMKSSIFKTPLFVFVNKMGGEVIRDEM